MNINVWMIRSGEEWLSNQGLLERFCGRRLESEANGFASKHLTFDDRFPLEGQSGPPRFLLKDESLEDSANLAGLKRVNPVCPASLDTLKVSVPPAVKLAAAIRARPTLNPDIIAAEIVEDLEAALSQFAAIAADLKNK